MKPSPGHPPRLTPETQDPYVWAVALFQHAKIAADVKPATKGLDRTRLLDHISVVLVRTRTPGNIGAAARAMKNMGLRRLCLVKPPPLDSPEIGMLAGRAKGIIENASIFPDVATALSDQHLVVGTTSTRGRLKRGRKLLPPREAAPLILQSAASQRVALIFGPERSGLSEAQLARCQMLVSIPAAAAYPVLNLAQAVLLVAYEVFLAAPGAASPQPARASQHEREEMYAHLEQTLIRIGFLDTANPGHIMDSLRRLLGAGLTPRDVRILRGICRQMEWFAEEGCRLPPQDVRKE